MWLRIPKINVLYILDTQTTIFAKLFCSDAIYNVSAAQYTLSAITYTRNVHFNWFNLRSPPENLLFKIMYNLPYFIPLGRIANSTLRECSEIVGFDPARVLKDRRACSEIVVRTLQYTYSLLTVYLQFTYSVLTVYLQFAHSLLTVHLQFTYSLLTEYLLNPTFSAHSTTIGRVLISSIQCMLARYVHY